MVHYYGARRMFSISLLAVDGYASGVPSWRKTGTDIDFEGKPWTSFWTLYVLPTSGHVFFAVCRSTDVANACTGLGSMHFARCISQQQLNFVCISTP